MAKLRVNASDYLPKRQHLRIVDHFTNSDSHSDKLAIVQQAVAGFVEDLLLDLDVNVVANVKSVVLRGFERRSVPFTKVTASATVEINIPTVAGVTLHAEVVLPIAKGVIYNPSLLYAEGKKYIYSKQLLEQIIGRYRATEIRLNNEFVPQPSVTKMETYKRPIFVAPGESNTWIDYLNDRYV